MIKSYKYRLYPTKQVSTNLNICRNSCRILYNKLLYLEKLHYQLEEKFIFYNELASYIKEEQNIYSQTKQYLCKQVVKNITYFYKNKKEVGFPKYKGKHHFKSFVYPQKGFKLESNYLTISKIGKIYVKKHREIPGKIKTCIIKKELDKWYVIFTVEEKKEKVIRNDKKEIGIDLGCKDFITLSNGSKIENPKYLKNSSKKLKKLQSKKDKETNRIRKRYLANKLGYLHRKVKNQRDDFHHKLSRDLANEYSTICIEKLDIKNIIKNTKEKKNLRKTIYDSGWSNFVEKLSYKVEETGSKLVKINPKNTTKMCSKCFKLVEKSLSDRIHKCSCGLEIDRDFNASLNILRLGLQSLGENP